MASVLALVLPPIISIAVTLSLERIIGTLVCIVIFPVIYALSLFITICGMTYLIKTFEGRGRPNKEAALKDHVRQLEQLVGKLAIENEFLKKAAQRNLLTQSKKKNAHC